MKRRVITSREQRLAGLIRAMQSIGRLGRESRKNFLKKKHIKGNGLSSGDQVRNSSAVELTKRVWRTATSMFLLGYWMAAKTSVI